MQKICSDGVLLINNVNAPLDGIIIVFFIFRASHI